MEWIKKNWMYIIGGIVITAIIMYIKSSLETKKATSNVTEAIKRGKIKPIEESSLDKNEILKKLEECRKKSATIRVSSGSKHPCNSLEELYNKAKEKEESSFDQFKGVFDKTQGLNVTDFAMGLEGLSLLEDKQINK